MPVLSDSQREALMAELGGLRRFCYSLTGNAADADDLLQTTVEKLLHKGMPEDAHAAKWSYRVCKNVWIDELRSRDVRQRYPSIADEEDESHSTETIADGERDNTIGPVEDFLWIDAFEGGNRYENGSQHPLHRGDGEIGKGVWKPHGRCRSEQQQAGRPLAQNPDRSRWSNARARASPADGSQGIGETGTGHGGWIHGSSRG